MKINVKTHAIVITNKSNHLTAELTYFLLPNQDWLLEQLFADSEANFKKYRGILIKEFFNRVPKSKHCVRVLDPSAVFYLRKHQGYQKYIHQI